MRERLLSRGKIKMKEIHADEIRTFEKIGLINAMNELGECMVDTGNVS